MEGAARDLLRAAQDVPLTNSVPISLAAAAVYIASIVNNERRKQKDVLIVVFVFINCQAVIRCGVLNVELHLVGILGKL